MRYVSLLAALLLGACAAKPIDKFAAAGPALKGQPIGALYDRWGPFERVVPPDIARAVNKNDGFVYVWTSNYSATYSNSTTSMGTIGTTPFSITRRLNLAAGNHTITVCAQNAAVGGVSGIIGGANNTTTQAFLTVSVINR